MNIYSYTQNGFVISNWNRPNWSRAVRKDLFDRFIQTNYANTMTLRNFLEQNQDAVLNGTIDMLHRRHIVSWQNMRKVFLYIANNGLGEGITKDNLLNFVHRLGNNTIENANNALNSLHAFNYNQAAVDFSNAAISAFLYENNVFVGPGIANSQIQGATDTGDDAVDGNITAKEAGLLKGTPHIGISNSFSYIKGIIDQYQP